MRPYRLTFLTVMPSPYQREFLGALASDPGFDVRVLYYTADSADRSWTPEELAPWEKILDGFTIRPLGASAHLNPGVTRELAQDGSDLVVVSDYSSLTAQWAMRWLSRRGRKWVFWGEIPGMRVRGALGDAVRRFLQRPLAGGATGVAAIGSRAVTAYRELVGSSIPVHNVPYHCETGRFEEAARNRAFDRRQVTLLFSGQMIPRKGVDTLLAAFTLLARERPAARLRLVGDGPLLAHYRDDLAASLGDRVDFAGFRQSADLPRAFAEADVFVLPSRHDGWGVVLNEALAAGLPIVTTSGVAAADDLVRHGYNGFVVASSDVEALAEALGRLVASAQLREQFSRASRELLSHWTLAAGVERWRALCVELLGSAG